MVKKKKPPNVSQCIINCTVSPSQKKNQKTNPQRHYIKMAYAQDEIPKATCDHVPDNAQTRNIIMRALKQAERIEVGFVGSVEYSFCVAHAIVYLFILESLHCMW